MAMVRLLVVSSQQKIQKRLDTMRNLRDKQMKTIHEKCGSRSKSFDVIPTKECVILWSEFDETVNVIHRLRTKLKRFETNLKEK